MNELYSKTLRELGILDEIREIYYENTGMVISFHYFRSDNELDFFPLKQRSEFCKLIQSSECGMRKCIESDNKGLKNAKKIGYYNVYRCHAGLINVAIPLMYKGKDIGAIYTGQVLLDIPTERTFRELYKGLEQLDIGYNILKEAYLKVKTVDKERLHFCARLLFLIANYIISAEKEIFLQRDIIQKDRELYKKEKEKIKLEKELKDLSISILEFHKKTREDFNKIKKEDLKNDYIISKAQLFIKTNYDRNIKLESVAQAVYLSPNYFSSMFKKITGYTFSSYLVKKRINAAKELLKNTNFSIKEIVYMIGFEDYNYFNRAFRKVEKIPPAQYRKLCKPSHHFKVN